MSRITTKIGGEKLKGKFREISYLMTNSDRVAENDVVYLNVMDPDGLWSYVVIYKFFGGGGQVSKFFS